MNRLRAALPVILAGIWSLAVPSVAQESPARNFGTLAPAGFRNSLSNELALLESGAWRGATTGALFSAGLTFADGGVAVRQPGERFAFASARRLDAYRGRLALRFKPDWDGASNDRIRYLLGAGPFRLFIYKSATKSYFVLRFDDAGGVQREVSTSGLEPAAVMSWTSNSWHDIVAEWDLTRPAGQQVLAFTLDGTLTRTNAYAWNGVQPLPDTFAVGTDSAFANPAGGILADLRIDAAPGTPDPAREAWLAPLEDGQSVSNRGGEVRGAVTFVPGEIGQGSCLTNSATGRALTFPTNGALTALKGTISLRFRPDWDGASNTTGRYLLQAGAFRLFVYYANSTSYLVFRFDDGSGAQREVSTSALEPGAVMAWKAGAWHTIECFWDLSTSNQFFGLSVDGVVGRSTSATWTQIQALPERFTVGASDILTQPAGGVIDELRLYRVSLWDYNAPWLGVATLTRNNGIWDPHETVYDAVRDAPRLDDAVAPGETSLFYERPPLDRVYPGSIPATNELRERLVTTLARGERTTLFFNLYSRLDRSRATLSVGTFTNATGAALALPDAPLRLVKTWWQAGSAAQRSIFPLYVPELMIGDETTANALRLDDPALITASRWSATNLPSFPVTTAVTVSPRAWTSRQLVLNLRAPPETAPGRYTATVTLRDANGTLLKALPIDVEVLPWRLLPADRDYSIYHRASLKSESSALDSMTLEQYEREIADLVDHGLNSVILSNYSLAALTQKVAVVRQAGIDRQLVLINYSAAARDLLLAQGYTPWFYGIDEPNDTNRIVWQITRSQAIHALGGKVMTAINKTWSDKLDDPTNAIYSLPGVPPGAYEPLDYANLAADQAAAYLDDLCSGTQTNLKPSAYYWQSLQELPAMNRGRTGFFLWNCGLQGTAPYVYQDIRANPYDDFDLWSTTTPSYRDHLTAYPSREGPVDTMQWCAYREGINDLRLLVTWRNLCDRLRAADPALIAASETRVAAVLTNYADLVQASARTAAGFAADRQTLRDEITLLHRRWEQSAGGTRLLIVKRR